ncbi:MAG: GNAT family N-acetyltransferase [Patescibacteria group bacterium]|jgi:GNAT superfamily N-acetyltransferase
MAYTWRQEISYRLNFKKCIIHLQADLESLPILHRDEFQVKELSLESGKDLNSWVELLNYSYGDERSYDINKAITEIQNHLFLKDLSTFLVFYNDQAVGSVSAGVYKKNPKIGGACRICVHPNFRRRGIGEFLLLYAYNFLKSQGIKKGESVVAIKRKGSIFMHFKCGFYPQYNRKVVQFKEQKRFFFVRLLALYKLRKYYLKYQKKNRKLFSPEI